MKRYSLILAGLLILLATACKPTEQGYKAAYDAAKEKREAALSDIGVEIPEGGLQQVDGAQLREVNGVKVYVLNQRIKPITEGMSLPGSYNVAVGTYKMSTNAKAQSEALVAEGYNAFPAKEGQGMYYTIAGSFPSIDEAVKFYTEYQRGKDRVYVGLPNAPIIIYSPR